MIQVGIIEPPTPAQVPDEAVTNDKAQGSLSVLTGQAHELGCLQVFRQGRGIHPIKAERLENFIGQVFLGQQTALIL